ncbi:MAG: hypothetical protein ABIY37_15905 [Devosia sp.]
MQDLKGTMVRLAGDRWEETSEGEQIGASAVLQVLTGSYAELGARDLMLRLGPDTSLLATIGPRASSVSVDQYSGTIDVSFASHSRDVLAIRTPGLVVSSSGGSLSIAVVGEVTRVAVIAGTAKAIDTESGRSLVLRDGQSASDLRQQIAATSGQVASDIDVAEAANKQVTNVGSSSGGGNSPPVASVLNSGTGGDSGLSGVSSPSSEAAGSPSSNAISSADSSAGIPPDSSASSAPDSNAGGNPDANAGGNPNSNAGGNSDSNAGSNSDSNAGGNPYSNAGGNPNSDAGGNPDSNAGGNPDSNAGGNLDSNAGGNPTSNAGGNPDSNAAGNRESNAGGNPNSNAGGKPQ